MVYTQRKRDIWSQQGNQSLLRLFRLRIRLNGGCHRREPPRLSLLLVRRATQTASIKAWLDDMKGFQSCHICGVYIDSHIALTKHLNANLGCLLIGAQLNQAPGEQWIDRPRRACAWRGLFHSVRE